MNARLRLAILLAGAILILGAINFSIIQKESLLHDGEPVLLELAPVDPRSLMQGDYMVLRYRIASSLPENEDSLPARRGKLVMALDENGVGSFRRIHRGEELQAGEMLLEFRHNPAPNWRRNTIRLGAESFFFQEGSADIYANARYGELRVAADGSSVLIGLRDENREILGERTLAADARGVLYNSASEADAVSPVN